MSFSRSFPTFSSSSWNSVSRSPARRRIDTSSSPPNRQGSCQLGRQRTAASTVEPFNSSECVLSSVLRKRVHPILYFRFLFKTYLYISKTCLFCLSTFLFQSLASFGLSVGFFCFSLAVALRPEYGYVGIDIDRSLLITRCRWLNVFIISVAGFILSSCTSSIYLCCSFQGTTSSLRSTQHMNTTQGPIIH